MASQDVFELARDPVDDATWVVTVPHGHPCFDGHFASNPVLPGVAQLAMVVEVCAAMTFGFRDRLQGFENVRFSQPLLPGSVCSITVRPGGDKATHFQISCRDKVVTTGTLIFR